MGVPCSGIKSQIRCPTVELRFLTASGRQKTLPSPKAHPKRCVQRDESVKNPGNSTFRGTTLFHPAYRMHSKAPSRLFSVTGAPVCIYSPAISMQPLHGELRRSFPHVSHQPTSLCRKENRPIIHFLVFTVLYCSTSFFICQSVFWRNGVFTKKYLQSFYSLCSLFCNFSSRLQPLIFLLTFSPFPFIMTVSHTTFERRTAGCQRNIADCLCAASIST